MQKHVCIIRHNGCSTEGIDIAVHDAADKGYRVVFERKGYRWVLDKKGPNIVLRSLDKDEWLLYNILFA